MAQNACTRVLQHNTHPQRTREHAGPPPGNPVQIRDERLVGMSAFCRSEEGQVHVGVDDDDDDDDDFSVQCRGTRSSDAHIDSARAIHTPPSSVGVHMVHELSLGDPDTAIDEGIGWVWPGPFLTCS
ncbi:MAG: hypothetical protein Q9159_003273 [Coniocarpon cinnabarinum]